MRQDAVPNGGHNGRHNCFLGVLLVLVVFIAAPSLSSVIVGQEVTIPSTAEGHPYRMTWRVNNVVTYVCDDLSPNPHCVYHWTPTQPGTITIDLTAYYLHETKMGDPYTATATMQVEVTTGSGYIFADGFEGGTGSKPGYDDGY